MVSRTTISYVLLFVTGCAFGQTGNSKGALSPAEPMAAIAAVRDYALSYTKSLPNYTCTQTTQQTIRPAALNPGLGRSVRTKVIEEQLSFVDSKEIRRIARIDGRPASRQDTDRLVGMSQGEFGNLLDIIFEPSTGASLRWGRMATLDRRRVYVIDFRVPQSSGYVLTEPKRRIQVPFEGLVYADAQTHAVLRIQMKCVMIPFDSRYQALDLTLDYKAARVAGRDFILPSHFALNFRTDEVIVANSGDYTNYRRFSADTTVKFEGDTQ
jgi:hypothetical protein